MAWIKSAGGTWTSTETNETWIKSPGGTWVNTKTGGQVIKSPGGTYVPIGINDSNIPTCILDDEDDN